MKKNVNLIFTSAFAKKIYNHELKHETEGSAGYDLRAFDLNDSNKKITIPPKSKMIIGTGIKIHLNNNKYVGKVYSRSSLGSKKGLILANSVGIIDSDYQGEIMLCLQNLTDSEVLIEPGERVAQLLIEKVNHVKFNVVESFDLETNRGEGGFGSTNKK